MMNFFRKKTKVYCVNCKYLISDEGYLVCDFPKNHGEINEWYKKCEVRKRWPKDINKKNNCKWFEQKQIVTYTLTKL